MASRPRLTVSFVVLLLLAFAAGGGSVDAHAQYVRSVPDSDAHLASAPTTVRVTFSESPEPRLSEVQVFDQNGRRVDNGVLTRVDATTLAVGLQSLGEGGYTVAWKTVSAVDGHETRGSFVFGIGNAPLPVPPEFPSSPPPSPTELLARILSYAGTALILGVPFFGRFVALSDEDRRGSGLFRRAGAVAVIGGSALFLAQTGGIGLIASRLGLLFTARAAAGAAALIVSWEYGLLLLAVMASATLTLQSHAAAIDDPVGILLDLTHVLAVGTWVGGLVTLAFVALPRRGVASAAETRDLGALVSRFSTVGVVAVALIVATGTLQSLRRLLDPRDLVETPYGLALLAKIVLLAIAVALASLNLLRYGPLLRANVDAARVRRLLGIGVRAEIAIVAVILVASSVLTALSPPNYATGAAYVGVQHAGDLRVQLLVQSPNPGQNRFDVRLQQGLAPAADVERVTVRFTMVEMNMGESELTAQQKAPGEYIATGSPVSMVGTWNTLVIVRRTGREDARALFVVPMTGGGGIQTKIVRAGQLNLFTYTDPATPVAGQPLAIILIPADQTGAPVTGAKVRAELDGKSYDASANGVLYRVDLPAQTAGAKRITFVVDTPQGESMGTYDVTVAP